MTSADGFGHGRVPDLESVPKHHQRRSREQGQGISALGGR